MSSKRGTGKQAPKRPPFQDKGSPLSREMRSRGKGGASAGQQWLLLVLLVSVAGLLLGSVAVALSLLSVSIQTARPAPNLAGLPSPAPAVQSPPGAAATESAHPAAGAPATTISTPEDPRAKGDPNAPVTIVEWFDYQCPACRVFALTREPEIDQRFISTGQVRFVSRNFAFLGPESFVAAEAAQCAADQKRYWDYRTLLFQQQRGENTGIYRPEIMKVLAAQLNLNQESFSGCLDRGAHRGTVLADNREAGSQGIKATPTLVFNGRILPGIPTVDNLGKLIEEEIAKKR